LKFYKWSIISNSRELLDLLLALILIFLVLILGILNFHVFSYRTRV